MSSPKYYLSQKIKPFREDIIKRGVSQRLSLIEITMSLNLKRPKSVLNFLREYIKDEDLVRNYEAQYNYWLKTKSK